MYRYLYVANPLAPEAKANAHALFDRRVVVAVMGLDGVVKRLMDLNGAFGSVPLAGHVLANVGHLSCCNQTCVRRKRVQTERHEDCANSRFGDGTFVGAGVGAALSLLQCAVPPALDWPATDVTL